MNGFRGKLRQFRKDWVRKPRGRPPRAAPEPMDGPPPRPSPSVLGFFFNADDTPRGARPGRAWVLSEPIAAAARRSFPRFRDAAANDGEPRAA